VPSETQADHGVSELIAPLQRGDHRVQAAIPDRGHPGGRRALQQPVELSALEVTATSTSVAVRSTDNGWSRLP